MRKLIFAGSGLMALAVTPAFAFGPMFDFNSFGSPDCESGHHGAVQVECVTNTVGSSSHHYHKYGSGDDVDSSGSPDNTSNGNQQYGLQGQWAHFSAHYVAGTHQLQTITNKVTRGSDNYQEADQFQGLKDHSYFAGSGALQSQSASNTVTNGDNNIQGVNQSQSLSIGGHSFGGSHGGWSD
jgi:hypothetical protein